MAIVTVADANDLSLPEFRVGKAGNSCAYPGIMQCFAVVGWRTTGILGMHVSPGFTEQDMTDAFAALRDKGGNWVSDWYVVGPFSHHFTVAKAVWRSVRDIAATFTKEFKGSAGNRWVLDCSRQRDEKTWDPKMRGFFTKRGLDIRAVRKPGIGAVEIAHKESYNALSIWSYLEKSEFDRF